MRYIEKLNQIIEKMEDYYQTLPDTVSPKDIEWNKLLDEFEKELSELDIEELNKESLAKRLATEFVKRLEPMIIQEINLLVLEEKGLSETLRYLKEQRARLLNAFSGSGANKIVIMNGIIFELKKGLKKSAQEKLDVNRITAQVNDSLEQFGKFQLKLQKNRK